jgi:hypothetical protein
MSDPSLLIIIAWCLVFGTITFAIAQKKNLTGLAWWFVIGAVGGIIGVILVIVEIALQPKAPAGMRAVKCPRCNAVQNIPETQPEYECWQCKDVHRISASRMK